MKLPVVSGREAIRRLQRAGFLATRQRGSHVRLERRGPEGTIKVIVPLHSELKRGTLARILKDSGVSVEEFDRLG